MKVKGAIEFEIIDRSQDHVIAEMPIQAGIQNPFGVVHAGAMIWFADVTATILVMGTDQAEDGMKGFPLAIALNASFLSNQKAGALKAVAAYIRRGRPVSVVRTVIYGQDEKLIAEITTNHVLSK